VTRVGAVRRRRRRRAAPYVRRQAALRIGRDGWSRMLGWVRRLAPPGRMAPAGADEHRPVL